MTSAYTTFHKVLSAYTRDADFGDVSTTERSFSELGISSLEIVTLIVELEEALEYSMPDEILTPEIFSSPATLWRALAPYLEEGRV